MRKLMLLAGAAILLTGQAALAQGKGQGGGGQGAHQGGGKGKGGGPEARGGGGGGGKPDRGPKSRDDGPRGQSASAERGRGHDGSRGRGNDAVRVAGNPGKGNAARGKAVRVDVDRVVRVDRGPDRVVLVDRDGLRARPAFQTGCPPGLAKKNNGCLPPGQAKKIYGDPFSSFFRYEPWYNNARGDDWRYMNGYAYRLDSGSGLVNAFLPLLGGALFPGSAWPSAYDGYRNDPYYSRYSSPYYDRYYDRYYGADYDYRYVDGAYFAVDPRTQRINSIAGLMAGDPWAVGSPMPPGYYAYNVPPMYRDRYYDGPNDWYRYSDGYVYRVDPTTQLVTAIIELLA